MKPRSERIAYCIYPQRSLSMVIFFLPGVSKFCLSLLLFSVQNLFQPLINGRSPNCKFCVCRLTILFPLYPEGQFCQIQKLCVSSPFPSVLKKYPTAFWYLRFPGDEKPALIQFVIRILVMCCFPLAAFKILFFFFIFRSLIVMCLGMGFFGFIMFGIDSAS